MTYTPYIGHTATAEGYHGSHPNSTTVGHNRQQSTCHSSGKKKQMCVSDHPTDSPFSGRPTHFLCIVRLKGFFIGDLIDKK